MAMYSSMTLGVTQSTQNLRLLDENFEEPKMTFFLPWELSSVARTAMLALLMSSRRSTRSPLRTILDW
jgi:hypothetical protein